MKKILKSMALLCAITLPQVNAFGAQSTVVKCLLDDNSSAFHINRELTSDPLEGTTIAHSLTVYEKDRNGRTVVADSFSLDSKFHYKSPWLFSKHTMGKNLDPDTADTFFMNIKFVQGRNGGRLNGPGTRSRFVGQILYKGVLFLAGGAKAVVENDELRVGYTLYTGNVSDVELSETTMTCKTL